MRASGPVMRNTLRTVLRPLPGPSLLLTALPRRCPAPPAPLPARLPGGPAARADDWPQWLGPRRDGVWRETGILAKFPVGGPKVVWRVDLGAGFTGPAVAGGRVYVMDRQGDAL